MLSMEDPVFESAVLYESIRNPITIELPVQNPLPGSPHVPVSKYIFYSLLQAASESSSTQDSVLEQALFLHALKSPADNN